MTIDEIKAAEAGRKVYWHNPSYEVVKNGSQWLVHCRSTGHAVGLTGRDENKLEGKEKDFYSPPVTEQLIQALVT